MHPLATSPVDPAAPIRRRPALRADTSRTGAHDLPTYNATDLTRNGDLAQIVLEDQVYRLRITRAGKLILTK